MSKTIDYVKIKEIRLQKDGFRNNHQNCQELIKKLSKE